MAASTSPPTPVIAELGPVDAWGRCSFLWKISELLRIVAEMKRKTGTIQLPKVRVRMLRMPSDKVLGGPIKAGSRRAMRLCPCSNKVFLCDLGVSAVELGCFREIIRSEELT